MGKSEPEEESKKRARSESETSDIKPAAAAESPATEKKKKKKKVIINLISQYSDHWNTKNEVKNKVYNFKVKQFKSLLYESQQN